MSNPDPSSRPAGSGVEPNPDHAALFANLVLQQSSMAMIFLGQAPHPESGKTEVNLDAAQVFIDTLEMLETKTRGNLAKNEQRLLQQTLMSLRMAFVNAASQPARAKDPAPTQTAPPPATPAPPPPAAVPATESPSKTESPGADSESHKRFSKKY